MPSPAKMFIALAIGLSVLSTLIPSNRVAAQSQNICDGAIPEVGKKFVLIKITENAAGPSGGRDVCVSVDEGADSVTFADLERVGVLTLNRQQNGIFVEPDDDVYFQRQECMSRDEARDPNPSWRTIFNSGHDVTQISIPFSDALSCAKLVDVSTPAQRAVREAGGLRPEIPGYIEYNGNDVHPGSERRYVVDIGQKQYIYFLGIQEVNADERDKQLICKQELYKVESCSPPELDELNTEPAILNFLEGAALAECKSIYQNCLQKLLNPEDAQDALSNLRKNDPRYQRPKGYAGPLPDCSFSYDGCRDINELLVFFIKIGEALFQVIGTFAFVMFIYGGFTIILSMGNAEKVKKGQEVLVAAVVGILIAFGAYLLIDFVLDALQVSDTFRAIK